MDLQLPPHAVLSEWADEELQSLPAAGSLISAYKACVNGTQARNEYKPYPIGKFKFHEARCTDNKVAYRLIYGKVRVKRNLVKTSANNLNTKYPIRIVGLVATDKKGDSLRDGIKKSVKTRFDHWLSLNLEYERDGKG